MSKTNPTNTSAAAKWYDKKKRCRNKTPMVANAYLYFKYTKSVHCRIRLKFICTRVRNRKKANYLLSQRKKIYFIFTVNESLLFVILRCQTVQNNCQQNRSKSFYKHNVYVYRTAHVLFK
jgi:hypothetical protein